jgi:pimeloyl-ACP methyl ester carboxylesterase
VREIAGAQFLELPGCGHAIPVERGAEVARAMGAFMNGAR